jgi:hypothetical protein
MIDYNLSEVFEEMCSTTEVTTNLINYMNVFVDA